MEKDFCALSAPFPKYIAIIPEADLYSAFWAFLSSTLFLLSFIAEFSFLTLNIANCKASQVNQCILTLKMATQLWPLEAAGATLLHRSFQCVTVPPVMTSLPIMTSCIPCCFYICNWHGVLLENHRSPPNFKPQQTLCNKLYYMYICCMMKPYIKDGKCAISSPMQTSVCISLLRAPL